MTADRMSRLMPVPAALRWPFAFTADLMYRALSMLGPRAQRATKFLLVGASGVVVNVAVMAVAMAMGLHYLPASILGTELSILGNFLLYERFVFHDKRGSSQLRVRAAKAITYNNLEFAVRVPLLVAAVSAGLDEVVAQFVTLVVAFVARFAFTSRVVYKVSTVPPLMPTLISVPVPEVDSGAVGAS